MLSERPCLLFDHFDYRLYPHQMGVFKKFFQTKSSSDSDLNKRPPSSSNHSTSTSSNTPPIQPLWALATEPELSPNRYSHYTYTGVGSDGRRRQFGPRDPRPSSLQQPHYEQHLSDRVQQLGLYDPRNPSQRPQREERPPAPPQSTRPQAHPQSHSYSHRPTIPPPNPSHSPSNPFPSYPPYPSPSRPDTYCDKPLPPTSHSPDRPRPRPQSRPTPPSNSTRRPLPSPPPVHSPAKSAPSSIPHRQQSKASPRRKKPPPAVVIEISSSSSSSSTAEFTDYEDEGEGGGDSSIEFMTTPSSSPSTSRRTRTPSPVKSKRLETPPSIAGPTKNGSRSPSPAKKKEKEKKTPTSVSPSKHSSPTKSTLSTPTTRLDTPRKTTTSRTPSPSPSPAPSPSKSRSKTSTPKVQCHGLTSSGKQCTRFATPTLSSSICRSEDKDEEGADEEEGGEPVYCHQHTKTSLVQMGCFVKSSVSSVGYDHEVESRSRGKMGRSREVWINYNGELSLPLFPCLPVSPFRTLTHVLIFFVISSDWILPDLPLQTQSLLRHYLAKPVSDKDREGWVTLSLVPLSSVLFKFSGAHMHSFAVQTE